MKYIGNTQQFLKTHIQQYIYNIIQLHNNDIKTDSFTAHFTKHLKYENKPTIKLKDVKLLLDISIIKKMDSITVSKRFSKDYY